MMACRRVSGTLQALAAAALVVWLPLLLFAQPHSKNPGALTEQQKTPTGPQLKVPIQKVQVPAPVVTLIPSTQNPIVNQNVHFTLRWNRNIYVDNYRFIWGDGQIKDTNEPFADHAYAVSKTYTAFVVATTLVNDREVQFQSVRVSIVVSPAPPVELPLPSLTANPPAVRLGDEVKFTAAIDPRVGPPQYHFYFDDNSDEASDANEITHIYRIPGTHHPYVVAVLGHGDALVTSPPIDVTVMLPSLTVTLETQEPTAGNSVTLRAALDSPRTDVRYEFSWDDGSALDNVDASGLATHAYAAARTYNVQVRAWIKGAENYPANNTVTIVVSEAALPPSTPPGPKRRPKGDEPPRKQELPFDWRPIAVIVVAVGAGAAIGWKIWHGGKRPEPTPPDRPVRPTTDLHVTGHPGEVSNEITRAEQGGLYVSVSLVPGMDPGEHRIKFL